MPVAANFFKALEKGIPRQLILAAGTSRKPDSGKLWILLDGIIAHITLTNSILTVQNDDDTLTLKTFTAIASGHATDNLPIFPIVPNVDVPTTTHYVSSQWTPFVINSDTPLKFTGNAAALALIQVLEWTP